MVPRTLAELRERAARLGPVRLAIAGSDNATALAAACAARDAGLVEIVGLQGTGEDACKSVAELASGEHCDVVLKGSVRTDELLRAILDRRYNLRTGRLLSDVLLYEDTLSGATRLVGISDGGVNVNPNRDALYHIIENAVSVFHALGFSRPRVALLSATEAVSEALPSTILARELANTTFDLGCDVAGPLALDNALLASAASAKGITNPVAGRADILIAPSIEAGNILGKSVKYFGGSACAHVVVGARVPVLIPSRVESAVDKLNSIALGVIIAAQLRT